MKNNLLTSGIVFVIFITLFKVISNTDHPNSFSNKGCQMLTEQLKATKICGVVQKKYLDKKSHMHETIIVNKNKNAEIMVIIPNELSGLYEFVAVGDSIIKKEESLECYVKRDSVLKRFEIDFGCNY